MPLYAHAAIVLVALALNLQAIPLVNAQSAIETKPDMISIKFGDDAILLERKYFNGGLSNTLNSDVRSGAVRHIEIPRGDDVFTKMQFEPPVSYSLCVKGIGNVLVRNLMIPARGSPADRERLNLGSYQPSPTSFPGVAKLVPPTGRAALNFYEFERDDLRDVWGDRQTFVMSGRFARLEIQISKDVRVTAVMQNMSDCFFKDGAEITAHIRTFVLDRLQRR